MALDLLVFGPHPDDIEIGLAGTIARHTAAGLLGRPVRSDRRRARQQRHARGAASRGRRGGARAGRALARESRLAGRRHCARGRAPAIRGRAHPPASAERRSPCRTGTIAIPITGPPAPSWTSRCSRPACAGTRRPAIAWRPEWVCYYFINDGATPSFVVDVSAFYDIKRAALACYRSQFAPADPAAVPTRLMSPVFARLIETRDGQFGALAGVSFAEGIVVREPVARGSLLKSLP